MALASHSFPSANSCSLFRARKKGQKNQKEGRSLSQSNISMIAVVESEEKHNEDNNGVSYPLDGHNALFELVVADDGFVFHSCLVGIDRVDRIVKELGDALGIAYAQAY